MSNQFTILKNSGFLLCIAVFISSCRPGPEKPVQESSDPKRTANKIYTIEIKAMKFQPAELVVQKGDTVVWVNKDIVAHDVTEEPGNVWRSPALATGQSWTFIVTESANYYCSIHVVMKGKLLVQ